MAKNTTEVWQGLEMEIYQGWYKTNTGVLNEWYRWPRYLFANITKGTNQLIIATNIIQWINCIVHYLNLKIN